jgi:hypothetical protein
VSAKVASVDPAASTIMTGNHFYLTFILLRIVTLIATFDTVLEFRGSTHPNSTVKPVTGRYKDYLRSGSHHLKLGWGMASNALVFMLQGQKQLSA